MRAWVFAPFPPLRFASVLAAGAIAILFVVILAALGVPIVVPLVAKAPPNMPACVPVGTMGMVTLYRCIDEDYGKVCYMQSVSGMLFCLEE